MDKSSSELGNHSIKDRLHDKHYYEQLLTQIPHGIIITDMDGKIQDWYGNCEDLFGYTKDEIIGQSISIIHDEEVEGNRKNSIFSKLDNKEKRFHEEINCITKDGSKKIVNVTVDFLYNRNNEIIGTIGVNVDVTEMRLKEELAKELEIKIQNQHKYESLGTLAAGVAHDYNNLFMGVMGHTSIMLDMLDDNDKMFPMIKTIQDTIEQAAVLSNQMLSLAGHERYNKEVLSLNEKIEDLILLLRSSIPKKIKLEFELETDLPKIYIDANQIRHVIVNLFNNAHEAIEGTGTVKIKTYKLNNQDVVLEISDTGIGMNKKTIKRIFDPFYTEKTRSRGLGLTIVDKILKKNNGRIDIQSKLGGGTVVKVLIPITDNPVIKIKKKDVIRSLTPGTGKVLVCDDEPIVLEIVDKMIRKLGYDTVLTANGADCLAKLEEEKDIIICLLDITMPDIGGIEVLERIREKDKSLPVILTSGYAKEKIGDITEHKNNDFLQKPYRFEDLMATLAKWYL